MSDHLKTEQAKAIAALLPRLMQGLFSVVNDPALDLPLAQLRVCRNLCDGPRSMSVLSRELGVSLSAMTQLADRLERANLVSRVAAHADRRVRCLQLTPQGEKMMRLRDNYRVKRVLAVLNNISP
ncbi:MAG: MarR family winged helix-turn-helix transcriptional regulator, partial [Thermoguttaceae bacterium]